MYFSRSFLGHRLSLRTVYSVTPQPTFRCLHRNTPHYCVKLMCSQSFLACLAHEYSLNTSCIHYRYHKWYLQLPVPAQLVDTPFFRVPSVPYPELCSPLSVVLGTDTLSHMRGTDGWRISERLLVPAKEPFSSCLPVLTTSLFAAMDMVHEPCFQTTSAFFAFLLSFGTLVILESLGACRFVVQLVILLPAGPLNGLLAALSV